MNPGKCVLLVNTRSLRGALWYKSAHQKLVNLGFQLEKSVASKRTSQLIQIAEEESSSGCLVIAGGGDGTLSAIASVVSRTNGILGVLPLGTGNAFARDLGIPTNLDQAISILEQGKVAHVDLGICNSQYFLNVATVGLTAAVARAVTVPLKKRLGRFVYAFAVLHALQTERPFAAAIETENGKTEIEAIQIVIGNGHFHAGPFPISRSASITNGSLSLYAVRTGSAADLLKFVLLLPLGFQGALKTVHSEVTTGGLIRTEPSRSVVIDGEVSFRTPIEFSIAPRALRVMVPQSFND